jgi:hypothetical protein
MAYDGDVNYKLDFNQTVRYLSLQVQLDDYHVIPLSGLNLDNHIG